MYARRDKEQQIERNTDRDRREWSYWGGENHPRGADERLKVELEFKGRGGGRARTRGKRETGVESCRRKALHDKVLNRSSLVARCT